MTAAQQRDAYAGALQDLLEAVDRTVRDRHQARTSYRVGVDAGLDLVEPVTEPPAELDGAIATYLEQSDAREAELLATGAYDQAAALLYGHWTAAAGLLLVDADAPERPDAPTRLSLSLTDDGQQLLDAVGEGEDAADLSVVASRYLLDHALPEIELGLGGHPRVAGGSAPELDVPAPVSHTVDHVAAGLVDAVAGLVSSQAIGLIGHGIGAFASGSKLGALIESAKDAVNWLKGRIVELLGKAVALARKFLGDKVEAIEKWINDHVVTLIKNVGTAAARWVLQADAVEQTAAQGVAGLDEGEAAKRLARLIGVEGSFDQWIGWGVRCTKYLGFVPASLYATPPVAIVLGVAVLGLLAFEVWTAGDHLDSPAWDPFDHVPGVLRQLG